MLRRGGGRSRSRSRPGEPSPARRRGQGTCIQSWPHPDPGVPAFRVLQIELDSSQCPGLRLIAVQADASCHVRQYSGTWYAIEDCSLGDATFRLQGGGAATGVSIPVHNSHETVVLATRTTFLSPDQNGDLVVDARDLQIARAKLGTSDPTADFDVVQAHMGHRATNVQPVATRAGSWGRIKSLFR